VLAFELDHGDVLGQPEHPLYVGRLGDQIAPIPNSKVIQGAGIIDSQAKMHFYAADPCGKLWVLHQLGWDANNAPTWAHMFPLDVNVASVASPLIVQNGAVLFAVGVDQTLHALDQSPATQQ
jgi:hypothetical protein